MSFSGDEFSDMMRDSVAPGPPLRPRVVSVVVGVLSLALGIATGHWFWLALGALSLLVALDGARRARRRRRTRHA